MITIILGVVALLSLAGGIVASYTRARPLIVAILIYGFAALLLAAGATGAISTSHQEDTCSTSR